MYKIIGSDGQEYGPVTSEQIRQWVAEGRVNAQTKIRSEGEADWQTLAELSEFSPVLIQGPPAASAGAPPAFPSSATAAGIAMANRPRNNPMALTGMILGICSLTIGLVCCGPLFAIGGIVFSIIGLSQIKNDPTQTGRGMAIAGLITGILGLLLGVVFMVIFGLMGAFDEIRRGR